MEHRSAPKRWAVDTGYRPEPTLPQFDTATHRPPRSRRLKLLLILDTLGSLILIPLAIFWGMMSVMASTTTQDAAWANAYALVNLSLPVAMLVCLAGGWTAWALRKDRIAWTILLLPFLWVAASVAMMATWPSA